MELPGIEPVTSCLYSGASFLPFRGDPAGDRTASIEALFVRYWTAETVDDYLRIRVAGCQIRIGEVAKVPLAVKYEGSALDGGEISVRALAPALLALGDLFTEASLQVHPDREPASLNIRATAEGSFVIDLAVHAPDAWDQVRTLLTGKSVIALSELKDLLFGTGGLLWVIIKAKNRYVEKKEFLEPGMVRITFPDGTTLEAKADAVALYETDAARQSAAEVVAPLKVDGISQVVFGANDNAPLAVSKRDLPAFERDETKVVLGTHDEEIFVTVATVSFATGYKWRFTESDRDIPYTASIEDPAFRARIDAGEPFRKDDILKVQMHNVQTRQGNKLQTERTVVRVLEHYPRAEQTALDI